MKYKVGDKVRIKSIDWYNQNKDVSLIESTNSYYNFIAIMQDFCGKVMTISSVNSDYYDMVEDAGEYFWTDEMIEGLVERNGKTYPYKIGDRVILKGSNRCATITDLKYNSWGNLSYYIKIDNDKDISIDYPTNLLLPYDNKAEGLVEDKLNKDMKEEWCCPEGYIFKDENGNIINATKIVLEKKHDDKLKLESTKKVREYWIDEYARIFIEIYDDTPNECVLTHLYTLESHRQKGYGRQALSGAESIAKELGCHTAYLKVETDSWMHEWYLRCGYQWYGNAPDNYTWLIKNL